MGPNIARWGGCVLGRGQKQPPEEGQRGRERQPWKQRGVNVKRDPSRRVRVRVKVGGRTETQVFL